MFGGILPFFLVFALMWLLTPEMSDEEKYKRDVLEHDHKMKMLQKTVSSEFLQSWQLSATGLGGKCMNKSLIA